MEVVSGFRELTRVEDVEGVVDESWVHPVIILKHSPTCGISAWAHEEIAEWLSGPRTPLSAYVVHVRAHRAVSDAIAERFDIRHQSPQLLLLHRGQVAWSDSHFRVRSRDIEAALGRLEPVA